MYAFRSCWLLKSGVNLFVRYNKLLIHLFLEIIISYGFHNLSDIYYLVNFESMLNMSVIASDQVCFVGVQLIIRSIWTFFITNIWYPQHSFTPMKQTWSIFWPSFYDITTYVFKHPERYIREWVTNIIKLWNNPPPTPSS